MIRVSHRHAMLNNWIPVEIDDHIPLNIIIDWLEEHGAEAYALVGNKRNRCISIDNKQVAVLFKLTWEK